MRYVPFLKYKVNEISALKELSDNDIKRVTPFFDLPRRENLDSESLKVIIDTAHRKYEINLTQLTCFYIDNYDIDDSISIDGDDNYAYVLTKFSDANIIPVVGIDRSQRRNEVVFDAKVNLDILSDTVALRVSTEDIVSYALIEEDIEELLEPLSKHFEKFHLIIDNRVCLNLNTEEKANQVVKFITDISGNTYFDKIIVTGSSVPASIRDLLKPEDSITIKRAELEIFDKVFSQLPMVLFGDYTTVSPNYSDIQIKGELMRRVTAPKLIYSFDDQLFVIRGGAIEGHPRGNKQYNDLSVTLVNKPFYRNPTYSFGDKYINDKANDVGRDATPSTIPKALINAHVTYMLDIFK